MSKELRNAYDKISSDYLSKKQPPWQDFVRFTNLIELEKQNTVIDVGAANGRNLHAIDAKFFIAMDLSIELLRGYIGPADAQRIAGALPKLPFRSKSSNLIMAIAVIHHIRPPSLVVDSLKDMRRIGDFNSLWLISVWRRWRSGLKDKLLKAIREEKGIDHIINHERPWFNSQREIQAIRFYHYYSFRELYNQLSSAGLYIDYHKYLGGKKDDANIFVKVCAQIKSE